MRILSVFEQPPGSYSALLTRTWDQDTHGTRSLRFTIWTIDKILASILKEIRIFEAGQQNGHRQSFHASALLTASSFQTGTTYYWGQSHGKPRRSPSCKDACKPRSCPTITCHKQHLAIVINTSLCFNCLTCHKVSLYTSKFSCMECHRKHHTSLCHAFTTTDTPSSNEQKDLTWILSCLYNSQSSLSVQKLSRILVTEPMTGIVALPETWLQCSSRITLAVDVIT